MLRILEHLHKGSCKQLREGQVIKRNILNEISEDRYQKKSSCHDITPNGATNIDGKLY